MARRRKASEITCEIQARCRGDVGEIQARYRGDTGRCWENVGEICGKNRGDVVEIWARYRGDMGELACVSAERGTPRMVYGSKLGP